MSYISVTSDRFVFCVKKLLVILETVCGLKRERIYDEIGFDLCFGFRCFASGFDLFRL